MNSGLDRSLTASNGDAAQHRQDWCGRSSHRPGVRATLTAVQFDPLLPFQAWTYLGIKIAHYSNGSRWWLGDWLLFGRHKYGSRYRDAIDATGLDYQTLRNYAVVARRFEPSRRREMLSFQHHAELCALDDENQDRWLDRAVASGWSRTELRRRVRASTAGLVAPRPATVRVGVDGVRARRWRLAAQTCGLDVETWIERMLDEAADVALGRQG
jgi:hypothetical protein